MIIPFFLTINQVEICFHGMARSGNHAIIDWITSMYSSKVDYWNNVANIPKKFFFQPKNVLIRSHENRSLSEICRSELEINHDLFFGKSKKRFNIILVRDPFNLFASRLQQVLNQNFDSSHYGFLMGHPQYEYGASDPQEYLSIWKEHAREYLGITSHLEPNKITINYNQWFLDKDYRQKIAISLGLEYKEKSLDKVVGETGAGGGSSFDMYEYSGKASNMKVLERWKKMVDNPDYRSLFLDEEVWTLSEQIFGFFPDTNILRS